MTARRTPQVPRLLQRVRFLRPAAKLGAVALLAVTLTGCGAGMHPAVLDQAPLDTQSGQVGDISVNGAIVVSTPDTAEGTLVATISNTGSETDTLVAVTFGSLKGFEPAARGTALLKPAKIDIPSNTPIIIPSEAFGTAPLTNGFEVGTYVNARFEFETAGFLSMTLLVVAPEGTYAPYADFLG